MNEFHVHSVEDMVADLTGEIAWRAIFTGRKSHGVGDMWG
jgi:hypothetical protein